MLRKILRIGLPVLALVLLAGGLYVWTGQVRAPDQADIAYGTASPSQKLDAWLPAGPGPHPAVIFAHGGAFAFGDKRMFGRGFRNDVNALNAAGIALISIDYRMSGEARFPAAVQDMKSALRYVRAHAAAWHIDPARIALWGQSAGANIALDTGLSAGVPLFDDPASPVRGVDDHVSAVVSMYGPTDFLAMDKQLAAAGCSASAQNHSAADSPESRYLGVQITKIPAQVARANPLNYVTPASPPLLLQHGSADCTVPPLQSRILADRAAAVAGAGRVVFQIKPGAVHADGAFDTPENMAVVIDFLRRAFAAPVHP
jgi:acetyl esterase/lipase